MPTQKFKIVYTRNSYGFAPAGTASEVVEFTCADPVIAVSAYATEVVRVSKTGWNSAEVFPVVADPLPLFTAKAPEKAKESKLFNGYGTKTLAPAKAPVASGPKSDKFFTPDSTWISHVTWEAFNSSIGIHFSGDKAGTYRIYKSDYATFCNFKTWVGIGNSAGSYYNSNIKGLPVLKSK